MTATHVVIEVPLRGGERVMTRRCLAGTAAVPLPCGPAPPTATEASNPEDPLLPAQDGGFLSKHAMIHKLRQVLQAAGVELTYVDPNGRLRQLSVPTP